MNAWFPFLFILLQYCDTNRNRVNKGLKHRHLNPTSLLFVVLLSALNLPETGCGLWRFIQSTASSGAGRLAGDACTHQARAAEARRLSQPEARICRGGEHPQAHRCIVADRAFCLACPRTRRACLVVDHDLVAIPLALETPSRNLSVGTRQLKTIKKHREVCDACV